MTWPDRLAARWAGCSDSPVDDPGDVVAATWREQSAQLVGALLRFTHDLDLAHDLANDAMLAALEQWPVSGVPDNPAAWLMTVAKRRAVDHFRRSERHARAETRMARDLAIDQIREEQMHDLDASIASVEDDTLRLMLLTAHPVLSLESQVALTLRLVNGLTSREISRAFLVPEATIVRRITRAKSALAQVARRAGADDDALLDQPDAAERSRRLPALMNVVYLVFTEGYAATGGEDWIRPALCDEAIRLGRLLVAGFGHEPEVHGLQALMWLQHSRSAARTDLDGDVVLLADQDRGRWDQLAIRRGSDALGSSLAAGPPGPYTLQAAIAACHARSPSLAQTDWTSVASLYDALLLHGSSPAVRLNRALAHGMAHGPEVGLRLLDELRETPGLREHHHLPSARGDLLARSGRLAEASHEFQRAATLAGNARERTLLLRRAADPSTG